MKQSVLYMLFYLTKTWSSVTSLIFGSDSYFHSIWQLVLIFFREDNSMAFAGCIKLKIQTNSYSLFFSNYCISNFSKDILTKDITIERSYWTHATAFIPKQSALLSFINSAFWNAFFLLWFLLLSHISEATESTLKTQTKPTFFVWTDFPILLLHKIISQDKNQY